MFGGLKNTSFMVAYLLMIVVDYRQPGRGLQELGTKDCIHFELIFTDNMPRNLRIDKRKCIGNTSSHAGACFKGDFKGYKGLQI